MKRFTFSFFFCFFWLACGVQAQLALTDPLKIDPKVRTGKLSNGLRYYIRYNDEPENRAELRLVVNAGSILETDAQQGLAHFAEHLCFNGTKNYPKQALVDYLEKLGMRFGPDLNAYTSFDETVYMLQTPTNAPGALAEGINVLGEWAQNVTFEGEEIDKERGVVIEEWRLGQGANNRMRDKYYPVLFKGSKYAQRLPIGKKAVLDTFKHETLRKFYRDWYRPELMAVVVVGHCNIDSVEMLIQKRFAVIQNPPNAPVREYSQIPDHPETDVVVVTDKEAQYNAFLMRFKHPVEVVNTVAEYRSRYLITNLFTSLLNARLKEVAQQANPPFVNAYTGYGNMCRTKNGFGLTVVTDDANIRRGVESALMEIERARRFGFQASELERMKKEMLSAMEQGYNERDNTPSRSLATEYISHYLSNEPMPGVEFEYELYKKYLPEITLQEVNALAARLITDKSRTVVLMAPEKEGLDLPKPDELLKLIQKTNEAEVKPYVDTFVDKPLIAKQPAAGKVTEVKKMDNLGIEVWTLSNGAKVVLKPTNFKADEVLMYSFSPGGYSKSPSAKTDWSAQFSDALVEESGLADFDKIQLEKALQGKQAGLSPYIDHLTEGVSGSATPKDVETLFQLVYLHFTQPRLDEAAVSSYLQKVKAGLANRANSPESVYRDTFNVTMANYHPRRIPLSAAELDKIVAKDAYAFYKDRFADASDFTFLFVGSFKPEQIQPFVEKYIAALPAAKRQENWVDWGVRPPKGVVKKTVKKGVEPKSSVSLAFTGDFVWNKENRLQIDVLSRVLAIKLRENMREEKGGTYGVRAAANAQLYPHTEYTLNIGWGCSPENVEDLITTAIDVVKKIQTDGPEAKDMEKVKEALKKERELNLKENRFWLNALSQSFFYGDDPARILAFQENLDSVTAAQIQEAAKKYCRWDNYIQVVLKPEN